MPDLRLESRANQTWQFSGIDSPRLCLDKTYFSQYPWAIDYRYNSRGFRDREWPESPDQLREAIWCIGDSYTVGVGQPFNHIWPQVLADHARRRTINISMDGASNDWIMRRAADIQDSVGPDHMVVMWSYTHRREDPRSHLSDENRRVYAHTSSHDQDYLHWLALLAQLRQRNQNITHCTIPDFDHVMMAKNQLDRLWNSVKDIAWGECPQTMAELDRMDPRVVQELKTLRGCWHVMQDLVQRHEKSLDLPPLPAGVIYLHHPLDWARDRHHFDILTSQWLVQQIVSDLL